VTHSQDRADSDQLRARSACDRKEQQDHKDGGPALPEQSTCRCARGKASADVCRAQHGHMRRPTERGRREPERGRERERDGKPRDAPDEVRLDGGGRARGDGTLPVPMVSDSAVGA
jgi:hypothetical protein